MPAQLFFNVRNCKSLAITSEKADVIAKAILHDKATSATRQNRNKVHWEWLICYKLWQRKREIVMVLK